MTSNHYVIIRIHVSFVMIFLDHLYTVAQNKTETISTLLCMLLLYRLVFYCVIPRLRRLFSSQDPGCSTLLTVGSRFKSPGDCDDSDLVLCTVLCGLRASCVLRVFESEQRSNNSGRYTIIFIITCGPLSCYVIGLQLDHIRLKRSRCI